MIDGATTPAGIKALELLEVSAELARFPKNQQHRDQSAAGKPERCKRDFD